MSTPESTTETPVKETPANKGKKWTDEEESLLLEELEKNMSIDVISVVHNRTRGGIYSRCKEIAYKMHVKNITIEEIILKTKLSQLEITQIIKKKQNDSVKKEKDKDNVSVEGKTSQDNKISTKSESESESEFEKLKIKVDKLSEIIDNLNNSKISMASEIVKLKIRIEELSETMEDVSNNIK